MARIPEFTRKVFLNRAGNTSASAAAAAAGGNEARQHRVDAQQHKQNADRAGHEAGLLATQRKADGKVRAQERFNEFQREMIPEYQKRRNAAQSDPGGFADGYDKFYRERSALIEDEVNLAGEGKNFDLDHFRQLVDSDRTATFQTSYDFENGQRVKNTFTNAEKAIDDMNANFALSNPTYQGYADHVKAIGKYANEVGTDIFSPQDTMKLTEFGIDNAATDFLFRQMQDDPTAARRVLEYGQGGKDALTDFIMMDIEGGAKIAQEPNGGIAKYGINSVANPGVDVRNLTAEGAADILKSKYYDSRLDEFPPQFQAVAFDALVNHGNDKDTWRMIEESNGNPYSLIRLRQEKYAGLVAGNPDKYAKHAAGWEGRMNKLTDYVQTLDGGGAEFLKHATLVDSQILSNARAKLPQALADKRKAAETALEIANTTDAFTIRQNEDELNRLIYDPDVPHEEKINALRTAEHKQIIGSKFSNSAESMLLGQKNLKKVEYNPNTIADMYARKEAFFNKNNKDGKKRVTVSADMLDEIGDMMIDANTKAMTGEITTAEAKAVQKSLSMDLAAAGNKIGKGWWFPDHTHDELAFKFFADSTDLPDQRNEMFRRYTEASVGLDELEQGGASKDQIEVQSRKIQMEVKTKWLKEQVPGAAGLDELPNQVFTINGDRIFVGAHSKRTTPDAGINVEGTIKVIDGVKFRMSADGKSGTRIE